MLVVHLIDLKLEYLYLKEKKKRKERKTLYTRPLKNQISLSIQDPITNKWLSLEATVSPWHHCFNLMYHEAD